MHKKMLQVIALLLALLVSGCVSQSELDSAVAAAKLEGYDNGYDDGQVDGYNRGYQEGYQKGLVEGGGLDVQTAYNNGYTKGLAEGKLISYNAGYDDGFDDGYDSGYGKGYQIGLDAGYNVGISDGYKLGYQDGSEVGYDAGYDDGYLDGYDDGYDDGWFDAGGSSSDLAKSNASTKLAMSFVSSIVDLNSLKSPKQILALAETDKTLAEASMDISHDPVARSAVLEKYLVSSVKKQLVSSFGLKEARATKIARLASKVITTANTRQLSSVETSALTQDVIGADLSTIKSAYEASSKGDSAALESLLSKAAQINEISVAQASTIMTKLFL